MSASIAQLDNALVGIRAAHESLKKAAFQPMPGGQDPNAAAQQAAPQDPNAAAAAQQQAMAQDPNAAAQQAAPQPQGLPPEFEQALAQITEGLNEMANVVEQIQKQMSEFGQASQEMQKKMMEFEVQLQAMQKVLDQPSPMQGPGAEDPAMQDPNAAMMQGAQGMQGGMQGGM